MIMRMLILVGLAVLLLGVWQLLRLWQRRRVQALQDASLVLPLTTAALLSPGQAAVLAFSTPSCAECRTRQAPALKRLSALLGEGVAIVSLSALDHPELVAQLGILTVPATVVLDPDRRVRHINLGYASEQRLGEQVASAV